MFALKPWSICIGLLFVAACSGTKSPPTTAWQTFRSPDGDFSILMPGMAKMIPTDGATVYGVELPGGHAYTIGWSDHVEEVASVGGEAVLTAVHDALVAEGQILKDETGKVLGHPSREVVQLDSEGDVFHIRMFLAGDRLYQIAFLAAEAKYRATDPNNLARFFDSFQLIE